MVAHLAKCLPRKHEEQSRDPSTQVKNKKEGVLAHAHKPRTPMAREAKTEES